MSFIRNNVDHYTGATFGCHENYSLERTVPWTKRNLLSLLAFLTLRVLFTGAGPGRLQPANPFPGEIRSGKEAAPFQISQRADFIVNDCFEWVQHNRAIINLRDEPLADPRRFRRLHLIHGDTNVLPAALFLKVGTTRLVLDLLEDDELPALALDDPVTTFRLLSRTSRPPWCVTLADGKTGDALDLLRLITGRRSSSSTAAMPKPTPFWSSGSVRSRGWPPTRSRSLAFLTGSPRNTAQ